VANKIVMYCKISAYTLQNPIPAQKIDETKPLTTSEEINVLKLRSIADPNRVPVIRHGLGLELTMVPLPTVFQAPT